jgi:hypothetical protein
MKEEFCGPEVAHASCCPKCALMMVVSLRFTAFESAFGHLPGPDEPLFFNPAKAVPVKANPELACRQVEAAALALGLEAGPILELLKFAPAESTHSTRTNSRLSAWERFRTDYRLQRRHRISPAELEALSRLALHGKATTSSDFLFMLDVIRKETATG